MHASIEINNALQKNMTDLIRLSQGLNSTSVPQAIFQRFEATQAAQLCRSIEAVSTLLIGRRQNINNSGESLSSSSSPPTPSSSSSSLFSYLNTGPTKLTLP